MTTKTEPRKQPRVGRPKKADGERRCKQTNHRWTVAEDIYLRRQAQVAGLSVAEFVRRRALSMPVTAPPSQTDARLLHELNAIGVNVNQLARNLNSGREGIHAIDWSTVEAELRRLIEKVGASFDD